MKSASSEGYSRVEFVTTSSRRGNAKKSHNNSDIMGMGETKEHRGTRGGDHECGTSDGSSKMTQINLISGQGPPTAAIVAITAEEPISAGTKGSNDPEDVGLTVGLAGTQQDQNDD